jgi:outer membrane scaffolding protein for murein synthesis (MipA/OmpV family)
MTRMRLALIALFMPAVALAQGAPPENTLVGAGIRSRPAYDGSNSQRTDLVPVLNYFGRTWFARTTQGILEGGAHIGIAPGLHVGAQLAYEEGRKTRESQFLRARGAADIDPSASVGLHLEGDQTLGPVPITLLIRLRRDVDADRGTQLDFRLTAGVYQGGGLTAAVFGQATWATERAVRAYYGQPGFNPSGGPLFTSLGVLGAYDLSRRWALVGSLEGRHLRGDAPASPLVERRTNHYATLGLAYKL